MKTILCYGDSNTWGYDPSTKERFDPDIRWTGVVDDTLGPEYRVIEEGLNGRTTVWDDPIEGHKNGQTYLPPCLLSHKPIDLVVLMLGTNDLKARFSVPAVDIARGAGQLCQIIMKSDTGPAGRHPQVLLVAPPPLAHLSEFAEMFEGGYEKSLLFRERYKMVADETGVDFLDAASVIETSPVDGVHFDKDSHHALGVAIALKAKQLIS